ncbi:MAG: biotin--[acetyl-CoA-carboxylase] ligase [Deltaproteobacteria bacterium]|jgi:BirA family biotin operon repressor/biotin-[acetyl-CoA-carboxylase] ligase
MKVVEPGSPDWLKRAFDIEPYLETERFARLVEVVSSLDSTNARAKILAREGASHGLAVVAFEQTAGRGQRGHTWFSPPGAGLYVSFVARPKLVPRMAPTLTLVAGLAARDALAQFTEARLAIKWPNDVIVASGPERGRKLAGILVEASADNFKIDHAVLGFGANLFAVDYPSEITSRATSLEALGSRELSHARVLAALADELEARLDDADSRGLEVAAKDWSRHALGRGEAVTVVAEDGETRGILRGIAEDGALLLATADGTKAIYRGQLAVEGVPPR